MGVELPRAALWLLCSHWVSILAGLAGEGDEEGRSLQEPSPNLSPMGLHFCSSVSLYTFSQNFSEGDGGGREGAQARNSGPRKTQPEADLLGYLGHLLPSGAQPPSLKSEAASSSGVYHGSSCLQQPLPKQKPPGSNWTLRIDQIHPGLHWVCHCGWHCEVLLAPCPSPCREENRARGRRHPAILTQRRANYPKYTWGEIYQIPHAQRKIRNKDELLQLFPEPFFLAGCGAGPAYLGWGGGMLGSGVSGNAFLCCFAASFHTLYEHMLWSRHWAGPQGTEGTQLGPLGPLNPHSQRHSRLLKGWTHRQMAMGTHL
nr:interferon alpha-inducible protein 27, mitochondrial isoform X1 [Macaca fascicularis]